MSTLLTLEQIKQLTHAFDDFITVKESDLPEYYKGIFPTHCECGGEVIMTRDTDEKYGYTQLQCCNPDCWIKMAHRFSYFCKSLGYKGFGTKGALSLYRALHYEFKYPTFLYIFEIPTTAIKAINGDAYGDAFEHMRNELKNKGFQFKDAIAALGLPDIGKRCALFDVVKDPVVLLDYILKRKINELCDIAGINASRTRYYLEMLKLDIITLMHDVIPHLFSTPKREINVAITGSVSVEGKALTRAEFIWKCERILDDNNNQMFKIVETKAESKLDYVIADSPSGSAKYSLGVRLNKLISADDFYKMLVSTAEECKNNG